MKRLLARAGFTFVELMLVVSIFSIVALAIYSTFDIGISAWKKAQEAQNLYQDIRLALDKMAADLENAVLYSEKEDFSNFEGKQDLISFYSLVETSQTIPAHHRLRKITYSLKDSGLLRLEQSFTDPEEQAPEKDPEQIASGISSLEFSYAYTQEGEPPYKWEDVWDNQQVIPKGVRVKLELETEKKLAFSRYVFIPTGVKGVEEQ